jgi:3-phosphoshikimate 1-carboxyvinyltransferase
MVQFVHPLGANQRLSGSILIPASKSHTIRALLIAALAKGESLIINPLESKDARSCMDAVRTFGAKLEEIDGKPWGAERAVRVQGLGGITKPADNVIDTGNSGTTIYLAASLAALAPGFTVFTGDHQIRNRPIGRLLAALRDLGATAYATKGNDCAPVVIGGPLKGGSTSIECPTSQYLSSLLIALPLADVDSCTVNVPLLHEQPYAEMTLRWLDEQGVKYENVGGAWNKFVVPGRQAYKPFQKVVPGDFSSATFFACAAAMTGSRLTLTGLDMGDSQGDKAVFGILEAMGCVVEYDKKDSAKGITVTGPGHQDNPCKTLKGGEFDLNPIPDALPALSVTACFASAEVRLVNVPQARLKETDRIAMMRLELSKMGAAVAERPDGLVIQPSADKIAGTEVESHDDHRIAMSLALAALRAQGTTRIKDAECAAVTFPGYFSILSGLGASTGAEQ